MRAPAAEAPRGRRWGAALAIGSVLTLVTGAVAGRPAAATREVAESRPFPEPIRLEPSGAFAHSATGFAMPERVGPFVRVEVVQYDEQGQDLSASYNAVIGEIAPLPIVATVYVYPKKTDQELDEYFEQLLDDIGGHHGGVEPEFRKAIVLRAGFVGRYAIFGYSEPWGGLQESIPLRSYVVLYEWSGWWVKWRATTPAPIDDDRLKAIVEFTETLLPPGEVGGEPGGLSSGGVDVSFVLLNVPPGNEVSRLRKP